MTNQMMRVNSFCRDRANGQSPIHRALEPMDKFVVRLGENGASSHNAKRAAPAPKAAKAGGGSKRAKPSDGGSVPTKAAWAKARSVPVPEASYQDQSLAFATLRDGRELLLGEEVWELPAGASAASPAGLKDLAKVGTMPGDKFAPLPGLDAVAVAVDRGGLSGRAGCLRICSLPGVEALVPELEMPGRSADTGYGRDGYLKALHAAPAAEGAVSLLAVTDKRLFLFTVRAAAPSDGAASATPLTCTLDANVDLTPSGSKLGAVLGRSGGGERGLLQATALYVDPSGERFALLGHHGSVLVAPLDGERAGGPPVLTARMHSPLKKTDRDATVFDLALWRAPHGCSLLSVGSDAMLSKIELDDGRERCASGESYRTDGWHATASGTGPSKQYRHAAAHRISVCNAAGIAITGSQFESVAHVWDLGSDKASAQGKKLCTTPRLAAGPASRVLIMCTAASEPRACFAYSNSNSAEDATLKLLVPCGKP